MRTEDARTSPSPAPSRRVLAAGLLAGVLALLTTPAGASAGTTERVSLDSAGRPGNDGSSTPALSADGRFVAFSSNATNLVPADTNGAMDVFVHDRRSPDAP